MQGSLAENISALCELLLLQLSAVYCSAMHYVVLERSAVQFSAVYDVVLECSEV